MMGNKKEVFMNKLEKLEARRHVLSTQINKERERIQRKEVTPLLKAMIGTCYIYKDNGFGGAKKSDRWDEFFKIIDVIDCVDSYGCYFIIENFSINFEGAMHFEITKKYESSDDWIDRMYLKISNEQYIKKRMEFFAGLSSPLKLIKSCEQPL